MSDPDSSEIRHGAKIGRFVVEGQLGSGGMGVVYAAHDRELDRRIALKVLRGAVDEQQRQRLMREGQAMARVTHENVITVHEVGIEGRMVFLAQELLDGGSLRNWLEAKHPQREILAKFIAAGRGLAAAHAAGLVHRDFKPDNVLLGKDGRVRVADFGLARSLAGIETIPATPLDPIGATSADLARSPMATMTRTGAVMGTPLYMSPEQHAGEPADERSDQFSFCVALYQSIYGDVPFPGKTSVALADAVMAGRMQPPPKKARVTTRLRRILLRGLATKPDERYPTMDALLADLTREPARRFRRFAIAAGIMTLVAGAVVGGYALRDRSSRGAEVPARRTIAVLGFKNLSGDPSIEYVSSAMSVLLATQLAADDVRVTPAEDADRARIDLALPNTESFAPETLTRIRDRLGSDVVVIGSYVQSAGEVTLVASVQDITLGRTTRIEVKGATTNLPALAENAGKQIRDALGIKVSAADKKAFAVLPTDATAVREFMEGTAALRSFDYAKARQHLLAVTKREASFAPGHVALAEAYAGLFDAEASHAAARQALANVKGLPIDLQMLVTAQAHELLDERDQAREQYRRLFAMHSDRVDYGVALARLQDPDDAVATVASLRKGGEDPVLDLAEATAELARPNAPRALELARKAVIAARAKRDNVLIAEARKLEGTALTGTGELAAAQEAYEEASKSFEAIGDQVQRLQIMELVADLWFERGLLDEAFRKYDAVGALRLQAGQTEPASIAMAAAAYMQALRGNLAEAEKHLKQADKYKGADPIAIPYVDLATATISWGRGDSATSLDRAAKCTNRFASVLPAYAALCAQLRGEVHAELGDTDAARKAYEEGLAIAAKAGNEQRKGSLQLALAQLDLDAGLDEKAAETARIVQPAAAARGATSLEAHAWIVLARALLLQASSQQALDALEHVKAPPQQLRLRVQFAVAEGLTHDQLGDPITAKEKIDALDAIAIKQGCINLVLETRLARAQVLPAEEGKLELEAVARDAKARGYNRIVKLAEGLAQPPPPPPQ